MTVELKNAIGYCRRSSIKQKGNHSIQFQKEQIELQANRMGYIIVEWCIDDAVSAFKISASERKGLQKLFELVLNDKASAVFFYDETRIDRSIVTFVNEIYKPLLFVKPATKFYSTTSSQVWDPFTIDIEFKLLTASYESVTKSQRTIDSQKNSIQQNKRPGSRTPFGLKKIKSLDGAGDTFVEDENAIIVRFINYLYTWGYSFDGIADILENSKVPAPGGSKWHKNTIEAILKRPIYLGDNVWGVNKNKLDNSSPVIKPELHELVKQAKDLVKKYGQFSTQYTFRSIAYCKTCNVPLKTKDDTPEKDKTKRKYPKYRCPVCKLKADLENVHSAIYKCFSKHWSSSLRAMEQLGLSKLKEMKVVLTKELKLLNTREEMLKYNKSMMPTLELPPAFEKHFVQVKTKLNGQSKAIHDTLEQIKSLIEDKRALQLTMHLALADSFDQLTNVEKRMIALTFIEKVNINMESMKVDIDFRLHPFIELENKLGRLTENDELKMDA